MKSTPAKAEATIANRLNERWADQVLAEARESPTAPDTAPGAAPVPAVGAWPHRVGLGKLNSASLASSFTTWTKQVHQWRAWAREHDLMLDEEARRVAGTEQRVPASVTVPSVDAAAAVVGDGWAEVLERGRARLRVLHDQFPQLTVTAGLLREVTRLEDLDFEILVTMGHWFAEHAAEAVGRTPRQVPVEGTQAKWLNSRQHLVAALAGLPQLGLAPAHPSRVHFTYLDDDYLASRGRRHDCHNSGDTVALPYQPRVVLISENKDTAVGFPRVPGGIAIEGDGSGAGAISELPWIAAADLVVYWGDMDVAGLKILNEFRSRGLRLRSILMDLDTYETYARFGTNVDRKNKPLRVEDLPACEWLEPHEHELLDRLTSGAAPALRIEQERIPLPVALAALRRLMP